ncbi:MAG: GTPase, partial [Patescibacteria group bacterium]
MPKVILFGRTNVGKSTLFNKLTETEHALVSPQAGTTRDSNIGIVNWNGMSFQLIDTGGILQPKFLSGKHKLKQLHF